MTQGYRAATGGPGRLPVKAQVDGVAEIRGLELLQVKIYMDKGVRYVAHCVTPQLP